MLKRGAAFILSFWFLAGGAVLPLSDFSLMKDLPVMYHAYEKVASPEEVGVFDFIGDYLLAGKTILDHNKNDKPQSADAALQFQHSPNGSHLSFFKLELPYPSHENLTIRYTQLNNAIELTDFHAELFRPPLV